ncbi:odorant receptor 67b-like [Frieseomelitta varia]|uniref:odorant receptor 67b-like n=1 Tax=Frieseomelitta varia TaxID=561572 RepID=UPI001CB6A8A0|nr:odorant receptor 67b-like [Frieseomelitta varia]
MLLNTIWEDWSKDRAKDELEIMVEYAERTDLFCRMYFGVGMVCSGCFVQQALSPIILDIILPTNETRDVLYIYPAYYLIDDRKYRSFIILHLTYVTIMAYYVFVGCDTSYVCVVQHACGQIAVASHRFKNAISDLSVVKQLSDVQDKHYERVRHSIQAHQHAINYLKIIENCHVTYLCICVAFVMVAFSVTLLKVASYEEISAPLIKDGVFLSSQLIHILFLTSQGQFVLNANDEIAESIYDASWYNANKETQLLFVLALRNCLSPPILSAGGLLTLNLETFAQIIKGSVSYFTVLKSS